MLDQLFNSVYSSTDVKVEPLMLIISLLASLALGVVLAKVYQYKTIYTKEFVMTLSLLPTIISIIIFFVNGNLGTSVAVAGTFSLIRFRSAAGGSKELLAIFIATSIGIATGMGFVTLAIVFTLMLSAVIIAFENLSFMNVSPTRRYAVIKIPVDFDYDRLFHRIFTLTCKYAELNSIKSLENGNLKLEYIIDLNSEVSDQAFVQKFLSNENIKEITLSRVAKKKKTL